MAARKGIKVSREQLWQWYYDEGKTTTDISELYEVLVRFDVVCPPPRLIKRKEDARYQLSQDVWRLGAYRKQSLDRLCSLLEPCLRHGQRR